MENTNYNVSFLSENVKSCFLEIFNEAIKRCGKERYGNALFFVADYLMVNPNNNEFDYIIEKYPGVTKALISQMAVSKFLEINFYRINVGSVGIDSDRITLLTTILSSIEKSLKNGVKSASLKVHAFNSIPIINDAYLYLNHLSDTYSKNACKYFNKIPAFKAVISAFYPLANIDFALNSFENLSRKETILGNLLEVIIHSIEGIQFINKTVPIFNYNYRNNNKNVINKYKDGIHINGINIYNEVAKNFYNKEPLEGDDIILMMELLISLLNEKKDSSNKLTNDEDNLLNMINGIKNEKSSLIDFYKRNYYFIIQTFMNNCFDFDKEDFLKYEFDDKKKIK